MPEILLIPVTKASDVVPWLKISSSPLKHMRGVIGGLGMNRSYISPESRLPVISKPSGPFALVHG